MMGTQNPHPVALLWPRCERGHRTGPKRLKGVTSEAAESGGPPGCHTPRMEPSMQGAPRTATFPCQLPPRCSLCSCPCPLYALCPSVLGGTKPSPGPAGGTLVQPARTCCPRWPSVCSRLPARGHGQGPGLSPSPGGPGSISACPRVYEEPGVVLELAAPHQGGAQGPEDPPGPGWLKPLGRQASRGSCRPVSPTGSSI